MSGSNDFPIDQAARNHELTQLVNELRHPFTQLTIDQWTSVSSARQRILQDSFWGTIRWPKSLGRTTGKSLHDGFVLTLRNHFVIYQMGLDGIEVTKSGWMDMAAPNVWDAEDDNDHYRVSYAGYYARYIENYVSK